MWWALHFCRKYCSVFVKVSATFSARVIATGCVAFNLQIQPFLKKS